MYYNYIYFPAMKIFNQYKITIFAGLILIKLFAGTSFFAQVTPGSDPYLSMVKSTQKTMPQLDSAVTELFDDETSQWIGDEKKLYDFDIDGNNILCLDYKWDTTTSQWVKKEKLEYTYDAVRNMTQYINYNWNKSSGQWRTGYKIAYAYDADANLTQHIRYNWNKDSSEWIPYYQEEYTYNEDNNRTQCIRFNWNEASGNWIQFIKEEFDYDANANWILWAGYNWDETTDEWKIYWKEEFTYDLNNNIIQYIDLYYDEVSGEWTNGWKGLYDYDADGNMIQYTGIDWDDASSQWINNVKLIYTYDADGNMTIFNRYKWDKDISQWNEYLQEAYTYNNTCLTEDLVLPHLFQTYDGNFVFTHQLLMKTTSYWDTSANQWEDVNKSQYYYSEQDINSGFSVTCPDLLVYPNPASGFIIIDCDQLQNFATIELYDPQGRKLFSHPLNGNNRLTINNLLPGVYIYRIMEGHKSTTGIFMVSQR